MCSTISVTGCTSSTWAWMSGGPRNSATGKSTAASSRSSCPGKTSLTWPRSGTNSRSHCCFPRCRERSAPGTKGPADLADSEAARTGREPGTGSRQETGSRWGRAGPSARSDPGVQADPSRPPRAPWRARADREPARCRAGMARRVRSRRSAANSRRVGPRSFPRRCRSSLRRPAFSSRSRAGTRLRPRRTAWACPWALACRAFPACPTASLAYRSGLTRRSIQAASRYLAASTHQAGNRSPPWSRALARSSLRRGPHRSPSPRRSSLPGRNCPRHSNQ